MSVEVEPGDPHNDQMAARARDELDQHLDSARATLAQAYGATTDAIAVIAVTLIQHEDDYPRDRLASILAAALVRMAAARAAADGLRERLAAIEHERWADWQRWMHSQGRRARPDGTGALVLPAALVDGWERQIATPYAELSDAEKVSDREQVDRYWPLIVPLLGVEGADHDR